LLSGRFPGFARLSFWKEQHVDEDEYGAMADWGKTEVLGENIIQRGW
jgi:hypothetical protein